MFGKCIICFVICFVTCYVKAGIQASSPRETTCLNYGGICVEKGQCPKGNLADMTGLCPSGPKQQRMECCHGLPLSATGCRAQAGDCVSRSYQCRTLIRADDCGKDEHCCVFVN